MSYGDEAMRTLSEAFNLEDEYEGVDRSTPRPRTPGRVAVNMLHAALGIASEAGEIVEAIKKGLFYGRELDEANLIEELGDLEWYLALMRRELQVSQEEVQRRNIAKLRVRYPHKFDEADAYDRDLDSERAALEE